MLVNPDYIGAYMLEQGQDMVITFESVKREMVTGSGGKKEECTVAHLRGQKPFIVNRTNGKMITKVLGTPYIEDWVGKSVTVYATTTSVAGEKTECLRVRPTLPVIDRSAQVAQINACKTIEELKTVWAAVGCPELETIKNNKKNELLKN